MQMATSQKAAGAAAEAAASAITTVKETFADSPVPAWYTQSFASFDDGSGSVVLRAQGARDFCAFRFPGASKEVQQCCFEDIVYRGCGAQCTGMVLDQLSSQLNVAACAQNKRMETGEQFGKTVAQTMPDALEQFGRKVADSAGTDAHHVHDFFTKKGAASKELSRLTGGHKVVVSADPFYSDVHHVEQFGRKVADTAGTDAHHVHDFFTKKGAASKELSRLTGGLF